MKHRGKKLELRLTTANHEVLRDRQHHVHDLLDLLGNSPVLDSEHKRMYLADVDIFTSEELDELAALTDEELRHDLVRLENLLVIEQKRTV